MLRRHFSLALLAFCGVACSLPRARKPEPLMWMAERGQSRIYLLGFAEARDRAWLTPSIERAFDASSELWLETTPEQATPEFVKELAYDNAPTFFDALRPDIRERTIAYVEDLGMDRAAIERMRPWFAYYRINAAFFAKYKRPSTSESPELVLRTRAASSGKHIRYEFDRAEGLIRFFASMPPLVQSQYVEMLLDYLDDEKLGLNIDHEGWSVGKPSTRALDRMRTRTPDLYRYIQADRNVWWASHIDRLLAAAGTRFVALGMNHLLGVDGVPAQLTRIGVAVAPLTF